MKDIPLPTKRRLVLLERLLSGYKEKNITSQKIQELTGWTSAVVRRDISALKLNCGATNGYKVEELKSHLEKMFGEKKESLRCCIVGLGRMGQALLDTSELYDSPFKIVAGFDSSVNKTEVLSSSFPLHPTTLMKKIIHEEEISYAIGQSAKTIRSHIKSYPPESVSVNKVHRAHRFKLSAEFIQSIQKHK